jgi:hypothetical protein
MRPEEYTVKGFERYRKNGIGYDNLKRVLKYLQSTNPPLINLKKGYRDRESNQGRRARVRIENEFLDLLSEELDIPSVPIITGRKSPWVTGYSESFELIRLKDENKKLTAYEDTEETKGMRARLASWNAFLREQWIDLHITDEEAAKGFNHSIEDQEDGNPEEPERSKFLNLSRNQLYRVFNRSSFDFDGRFYGGWWQEIPSEYRKHITINWYETIELDFSNMQAAMLYAKEGLELPEDAYALEGVNENYRPVIKQAFFKLINALKEQKVRPIPVEQLPAGMSWNELVERLRQRHQPIAKYFNTGIGLELMRFDSESNRPASYAACA